MKVKKEEQTALDEQAAAKELELLSTALSK
jgi:hypothetical protein